MSKQPIRRVRIVRYGKTPDAWTKEMLEEEAAICCADEGHDIFNIWAGGDWVWCNKKKKNIFKPARAVDEANIAIEELYD